MAPASGPPAPPTEATSPANSQAEPGTTEGRALTAAHLEPLARIALVLRGQLDGVQADTATAAQAIVGQTNAVDAQLRSLIALLEQEAARLLERSVEEGLQVGEDQGALAMLQRFLERSAAHAHDGEERARLISEAAASAAPVISELRELAMQSKVLSINASVESARQGGAFAVIAEEVRNVSARSAAAVAQVEEAISRVAGLVGAQLTETTLQARQQDASDREQLKRFAALVGHRADEQRQRDEERQQLLGSVAAQHDQLRAKVIALLASAQFEDVTRQRVDGVRSALNDMQRCLEGLVAALRTPEAWALLPAALDEGRLLEDYVMDQQRAAHARALGDETETDGLPKVELF